MDGHIEIPKKYLPDGVERSGFDPAFLRALAEAHNKKMFHNDVLIKSWVLLYLLDQLEDHHRNV